MEHLPIWTAEKMSSRACINITGKRETPGKNLCYFKTHLFWRSFPGPTSVLSVLPLPFSVFVDSSDVMDEIGERYKGRPRGTLSFIVLFQSATGAATFATVPTVRIACSAWRDIFSSKELALSIVRRHFTGNRKRVKVSLEVLAQGLRVQFRAVL